MQIKSYTSLLNKINIKRYNIGIVGLGYVGLPLVKRFLKTGNIKIYGVDNDEKKVNLLKKGKSPIKSININYFKNNKDNVTTSYSILMEQMQL